LLVKKLNCLSDCLPLHLLISHSPVEAMAEVFKVFWGSSSLAKGSKKSLADHVTLND